MLVMQKSASFSSSIWLASCPRWAAKKHYQRHDKTFDAKPPKAG
jgi:hypothetical protein